MRLGATGQRHRRREVAHGLEVDELSDSLHPYFLSYGGLAQNHAVSIEYALVVCRGKQALGEFYLYLCLYYDFWSKMPVSPQKGLIVSIR